MYAIIETGGKQYRVKPGDVVSLEKLSGDVGQTLTFDKVLLVGGKTDNQTLVGTPYVASAALTVEIVDQAAKGEKLLTIKYKRRKGYRRMIGHRQQLTRVLVTKLEDGKGGSLAVEAAKRTEALRLASVPFSKRQETHAAKVGKKASATSGAAKAEKKTAAKKSAGTAAKKTAAKK